MWLRPQASQPPHQATPLPQAETPVLPRRDRTLSGGLRERFGTWCPESSWIDVVPAVGGRRQKHIRSRAEGKKPS